MEDTFFSCNCACEHYDNFAKIGKHINCKLRPSSSMKITKAKIEGLVVTHYNVTTYPKPYVISEPREPFHSQTLHVIDNKLQDVGATCLAFLN